MVTSVLAEFCTARVLLVVSMLCRGFDIGNHFCEWCYCYDHDEFPYFTASLDDYPSREQQVTCLRCAAFGDVQTHS